MPVDSSLMKTKNKTILVYGIGNSGRQDDGLAWDFIDSFQTLSISKEMSCEKNYQLNIEDAALIAEYDLVIFVDASSEQTTGKFKWERLIPHAVTHFSSHELCCESVLALCHEMYNSEVEAYLLSIRGYEWELAEGLCQQAQRNLEDAISFFEEEVASSIMFP